MKFNFLFLLLLFVPLSSATIVDDALFFAPGSNTSVLVNTSINLSSITNTNESITFYDWFFDEAVYLKNSSGGFELVENGDESYTNYTFNTSNAYFKVDVELLSFTNISLSDTSIEPSEFSTLTADLVGGVSDVSSVLVEIVRPDGVRVNESLTLTSGQSFSFVFDSDSFSDSIYGQYNFVFLHVNNSEGVFFSSFFNGSVTVFLSGSGYVPGSGGSLLSPAVPSSLFVNDSVNVSVNESFNLSLADKFSDYVVFIWNFSVPLNQSFLSVGSSYFSNVGVGGVVNVYLFRIVIPLLLLFLLYLVFRRKINKRAKRLALWRFFRRR